MKNRRRKNTLSLLSSKRIHTF